MDNTIIDDLYEASIATERWHGVLDQLTQLGGGAGASFITMGQGPVCLMATPMISDLIQDYFHQPHQNIRIDAGLRTSGPGFFTDADLLSTEVIKTHPFFTEFLRPRGLGCMFGTIVRAPGAQPIIFSVERRHEHGLPGRALLGKFDALRPHMARALLLSTRLGLERARAKVEALGLVGMPAAVVERHGRAIAMNQLCEKLMPDVLADRRLRVMFTDARADQLFTAALSSVNQGGNGQAPQSFPVHAQDAFPGAVAHLIPVRGIAHDIFSPGAAILLVTPLIMSGGPETGLLEALFDFTPAEARIAAGLAEALSVEKLAERFQLSRETVRGHLKVIFAKTGTRRQAELVYLLAHLPKIGPGHTLVSP